MKTINYFILLGSLLFAMSCLPSNDDLVPPILIDNGGAVLAEIELSECYELEYQNIVYFEAADFTIFFDTLLEDSRCPIDAICIWEGRAWVRLSVYENGEETLVDLITENSLNQDSMLTAEYGDYIFVLKNVNPHPVEGVTTNQAEYNVQFSIEDAATYNPCQDVVVDNATYENAQSADFFLINAVLNGDCLDIEISASGCDSVNWTADLLDSGDIAESLPEQRFIKFKLHNDELCAAVFTRTFSFDLVPLRTSNNEVLLNLEGWEGELLYSY